MTSQKNDSETVASSRIYFQSRIDHWKEKMNHLMDSCEHPGVISISGSSTGHYDNVDSYWIDHSCNDCGKAWREDK